MSLAEVWGECWTGSKQGVKALGKSTASVQWQVMLIERKQCSESWWGWGSQERGNKYGRGLRSPEWAVREPWKHGDMALLEAAPSPEIREKQKGKGGGKIRSLIMIMLKIKWFETYQIRSVTQSCPTLCDPMNRSTPGLPAHHQLPEFTQTHIHRVSDAIQLSHPLSSPSLPAPNPSQNQSLFQWVNSSHEVAKVLEFQL